MNTKNIKKYLPLAAVAGAALWLINRGKTVNGVGATSRKEWAIAKVTDVRYRNATQTGNPSYFVDLVTPLGYHMTAYTAPNAQIAYAINNPEYRNQWHVFWYTNGARGSMIHYATPYNG